MGARSKAPIVILLAAAKMELSAPVNDKLIYREKAQYLNAIYPAKAN